MRPLINPARLVPGLRTGGGGICILEVGITPLVLGQAYIDVVFATAQPDTAWDTQCSVVNTIDATPLNIWPGIITAKATTGFRLQLSGLPDSSNYFLHWAISPGVALASTYSLSGPTSGAISTASSNFTVTLVGGGVASPVTVTPSAGGGGGTFTPASVTLTTGAPSATFTYTPSSYGAKTISTTNGGGLTDPGSLTYTSIATTYTLTGPSTGTSGTPSTNFTVALPGGGAVIGTVTVTPNDSSGGGTFTPTTVGLTTAAPSATFTYTPASAGTKTISVTNSAGMTNPANISYSATAPFSPDSITGLKLWLKADSLALADGTAVSTWSDSSGNANHALGTTTARPVYKTSIVNGKPVVRFDGVDDRLVLTTELSFASGVPFTVYIVHQTSGDGCFLGGITANIQLRIGESGLNKLSFYTGGTVYSDVLAASRSAWNIVTYLMTAFGGIGTLYFIEAGTLRNSGVSGATSIGVVGALGLPDALHITGDIAEILIYDSALLIDDRQDVEGYLGTKYGITVATFRDALIDRIGTSEQ